MSYVHKIGASRLCNQIFRNLSVSIVAEKHNLLVNYHDFDKITAMGIPLFVGNARYNETRLIGDNNYFDILNSQKINYNVDAGIAYFQTKEISNSLYNYLQESHVRRSIIKNNPFKHRINNNNDCFIHLRLTDVAQHVPSIKYFMAALVTVEFDHLYIASDDLEHKMIKMLVSRYPTATLIDYDEVHTIQFGCTNKHIILSHGSYSAIIGYLAHFSNVIYSKYDENHIWYGDMFSIPGWQMIGSEEPRQQTYLIITTCIYNKFGMQNYELRKNEYLQSIRKTLSYLPASIKPIIVENSGLKSSYLDELNIPVCYTDNNRKKYWRKGVHELEDIKAVITQFNIKDSDMIIKITGRYHPLSDFFFNHVLKNVEKDAFLSFFNVCTHEYMENDCVLGFYAIRCKYLKKFTYEDNNISAEVEFAKFVRENIGPDRLVSLKKLQARCYFAESLQVLDV